MPAELSGLQLSTGGAPNITVSNALSHTPFNAGSAAAGVGTGNLGQFGGYIPTPLPQFNNYLDYLSFMPGAQQMDSYAEMMIKPSFYQFNPQAAAGYQQQTANNPFSAGAMQGTYDALTAALGGTMGGQTPIQMAVPGPDGTTIVTDVMMPSWDPNGGGMGGGGFVNQNWLPAARRMFGEADKLWGLEDPIIQQAFDPQNALYGRMQQQLQDQTRAGLAARGLTMDPYGAGVEGSTMANFNIDWQNQQLQRMLQGAQGVAGLSQAGGAMAQGGAGLQDRAIDLMQRLPRAPMDLWNEIQGTGMTALTDLARYGQAAAQPYQAAFQNWQDIQNQFLTANQQTFNQNQISGFEDPFAMLQLQSEIEMQREQMNMQEKMMEKQMKQQQAMQGAQMGMGMLGGMGGK